MYLVKINCKNVSHFVYSYYVAFSHNTYSSLPFPLKMFVAYNSHIVIKVYYPLRLCVEILTSLLFSGPRLAANKHSVSKVSSSQHHFLVNYPDYP